MADEFQLPPPHRRLNQRLLVEHCLPENDLKAIWGEDSEETLDEALRTCNQALRPGVGLEIIGIAEDDTVYYCMRNVVPDDTASKTSFKTTDADHAFQRAVWEYLVDNLDGVKRAELINLRLDLEHKMDLQATEACLDELVYQKWIAKKNGRYSLAPRAYAELSYFFIGEFGLEKEAVPQEIYFR